MEELVFVVCLFFCFFVFLFFFFKPKKWNKDEQQGRSPVCKCVGRGKAGGRRANKGETRSRAECVLPLSEAMFVDNSRHSNK